MLTTHFLKPVTFTLPTGQVIQANAFLLRGSGPWERDVISVTAYTQVGSRWRSFDGRVECDQGHFNDATIHAATRRALRDGLRASGFDPLAARAADLEMYGTPFPYGLPGTVQGPSLHDFI